MHGVIWNNTKNPLQHIKHIMLYMMIIACYTSIIGAWDPQLIPSLCSLQAPNGGVQFHAYMLHLETFEAPKFEGAHLKDDTGGSRLLSARGLPDFCIGEKQLHQNRGFISAMPNIPITVQCQKSKPKMHLSLREKPFANLPVCVCACVGPLRMCVG